MSAKSQILIVCSVIFTDMLGFSLIIPSIPFVVSEWGGSSLALGIVFTAYSLAQALAAPLLGKLSDRIGRRPLLLLALIGSTLALLLAATSTSLPMLILSRVIGGLSGGSIAIAMAMLSDMSDKQNRTKLMGMGGASIGMAFTFGPAIGALLSPFGFTITCLVGAAICALNFVFAYFMLEHHPKKPKDAAPINEPMATSKPVFFSILAISFLTMLMFVGMETTLGLLTALRFETNVAGLGWLLTYAGICYVIVQAGIVHILGKKYGERNTIICAAALMALSFALMPTLPFPAFLVALGFVAGSQGIITTLSSSLSSRAGSEKTTGQRMGMNQASAALGRLTGPILGGATFAIGPQFCYAVMAVIALAIIGVSLARLTPKQFQKSKLEA